jgi:hypothetical protein
LTKDGTKPLKLLVGKLPWGDVALPATNLLGGRVGSFGFLRYADVLFPALLAYMMLDRAI